jgi:hypothetical protein
MEPIDGTNRWNQYNGNNRWNQYNGNNTMEPIHGTNIWNQYMELIDGTNTMVLGDSTSNGHFEAAVMKSIFTKCQ